MTPLPPISPKSKIRHISVYQKSTHCKTQVFIKMHSNAIQENPKQTGLIIRKMHLLLWSETRDSVVGPSGVHSAASNTKPDH